MLSRAILSCISIEKELFIIIMMILVIMRGWKLLYNHVKNFMANLNRRLITNQSINNVCFR